MLLLLSPAKTLDLTPAPELPSTQPRFAAETRQLVKIARRLKPADLSELMDISDKLAELNHDRFKRFDPGLDGGVQAALAFAGDVYEGLDARSLDGAALDWAQDHVRILSGLYGVLRPLDCIQPYRLEMGVSLKTPRGRTLYDFWGDRISKALNADIDASGERVVVNLASQEYFGAVDARALKPPVINVRFKEEKGGEVRTLAFYAKKARGLMARFAIERRLERADELKAFDGAGYRFEPAGSSERDWLFVRPQPEPKAG